MIGSIPIPNTRFYLTSIDGKKWFVTEYYRTAPFNLDKETYDLYKAFAEAFQKTRGKSGSSRKNSKTPSTKRMETVFMPDDIVLISAEPNKKRGGDVRKKNGLILRKQF